jgi:hypothetical protein
MLDWKMVIEAMVARQPQILMMCSMFCCFQGFDRLSTHNHTIRGIYVIFITFQVSIYDIIIIQILVQ